MALISGHCLTVPLVWGGGLDRIEKISLVDTMSDYGNKTIDVNFNMSTSNICMHEDSKFAFFGHCFSRER